MTQLDISEGIYADVFGWMGSFIYSFHMHAFFFISGFVSVKILSFSLIREKIAYIMNRSKRLLIPYCVMGLIYLPARLFLSGMSRNDYSIQDIWKVLIGENPDGALWFLYVLFVISAVACLIVTRNNLKVIIAISFAVCFMSSFISFPIDVIGRLLTYFPFFTVGILARLNYKKIVLWLSDVRVFVIALVFFVVANVALYTTDICCIQLGTAVSGTICLLFASIYLSNIKNGITKEPRTICKIIGSLGFYSMDIYVFSEPIKVIVRTLLKNIPIIINVVCCTVVAIVVPIIISKIIVRRVKLFRLLFLGMD